MSGEGAKVTEETAAALEKRVKEGREPLPLELVIEMCLVRERESIVLLFAAAMMYPVFTTSLLLPQAESTTWCGLSPWLSSLCQVLHPPASKPPFPQPPFPTPALLFRTSFSRVSWLGTCSLGTACVVARLCPCVRADLSSVGAVAGQFVSTLLCVGHCKSVQVSHIQSRFLVASWSRRSY